MQFHGAAPEIENTLTLPKVEEPIKRVGPSSLAITRGKGGEHYEANLWVGGEGLDVDQRWGENFQFSFVVPYDSGIVSIPAHAGMMLAKYRTQIVHMYGREVGEAVICAIGQVVSGHFLRRPYTPEEIMKDLK